MKYKIIRVHKKGYVAKFRPGWFFWYYVSHMSCTGDVGPTLFDTEQEAIVGVIKRIDELKKKKVKDKVTFIGSH